MAIILDKRCLLCCNIAFKRGLTPDIFASMSIIRLSAYRIEISGRSLLFISAHPDYTLSVIAYLFTIQGERETEGNKATACRSSSQKGTVKMQLVQQQWKWWDAKEDKLTRGATGRNVKYAIRIRLPHGAEPRPSRRQGLFLLTSRNDDRRLPVPWRTHGNEREFIKTLWWFGWVKYVYVGRTRIIEKSYSLEKHRPQN